MPLVVALFVSALTASCTFMPNEPYWIEAFGQGQASRIAAGPVGGVIVGTDAHLYTYPGPWGRPWVQQGAQGLRAVAASQQSIYGILDDGQVARFARGGWVPYAGSSSWNASEVLASPDDRLLVVASGRLMQVDQGELKETECSELNGVAAAGVRDNEAFVIDQIGALYLGRSGQCVKVESPVRFRRIAARQGRVVGVGVDGRVWRRRDGGAWAQLSAPMKYRPGRAPFKTDATEVALSSYATWIVDNEGSIFLLSDES